MPGAQSAGTRAPDFTLRAAPGAPWQGLFRLSDALGKKPIVIAFFATFCEPCERELAQLERLRGELASQGLVLAAVSIDDSQSCAGIGPMAQRLRLSFPVLWDADSTVTTRYNPRRMVPFLVEINRQGRIVESREGYTVAHAQALPQELRSLLAP